jgi:hypothetical protein
VRSLTIANGKAHGEGGAYGGGSVGKSLDGADTWRPVNAGLPTIGVTVLAIDPMTTTTVYAGTNGAAVFKSTDGASTWQAAGTGLPADVTALAIDPTTLTTLYAVAASYGAKDGGVYKSTAAGSIWSATGLTDLWAGLLGAINPARMGASGRSCGGDTTLRVCAHPPRVAGLALAPWSAGTPAE